VFCFALLAKENYLSYPLFDAVMIMIYDCFPFFNELELLELRLNELAGVVDKFVLVEATRTFTNQPKPLCFQENRERFAAFADKIIHVVVTDSPDSTNPWVVEHFQRNCIARGLTQCRADDWVLVSDLDEIPRATVVKKISQESPFHAGWLANTLHGTLNSRLSQNIFKRKGFRRLLRKNHPFVWKFEQTLYRHFMNCRSPEISHGTRLVRFRDFSCAEEIRHSGRKRVNDGGWHFTWMGGVDRIRQKFAAYAHQEHNQPQYNDPQHLARVLNEGSSIFNSRDELKFVPLDDSFPRYLVEHPEIFSNWVRPI
jgi:beta-1,4-mannosyl-glycoprotein beta-1,4-N-acetylglucosaminyltransferase